MIFNDNDRKRLRVTASINLDPATATIAVSVDGIAYPCTWEGPGTHVGQRYTRSATSDGWFAGSAVPSGQVNGAAVLAKGLHITELLVTVGETIVSATVEPIFVVA